MVFTKTIAGLVLPALALVSALPQDQSNTGNTLPTTDQSNITDPNRLSFNNNVALGIRKIRDANPSAQTQLISVYPERSFTADPRYLTEGLTVSMVNPNIQDPYRAYIAIRGTDDKWGTWREPVLVQKPGLPIKPFSWSNKFLSLEEAVTKLKAGGWYGQWSRVTVRWSPGRPEAEFEFWQKRYESDQSGPVLVAVATDSALLTPRYARDLEMDVKAAGDDSSAIAVA